MTGPTPVRPPVRPVPPNWESADALDAHLAMPHLTRFAGLLDDLLDGDGRRIDRLRRIA